MPNYPEPFGYVRVWLDGDGWRYVPAGEWVPEHAELAQLLDDNGEHVVYINRGNRGEFIRGAAKG